MIYYKGDNSIEMFMREVLKPPAFDLGAVTVTEGARRALTCADIKQGLFRHVRCDWGEIEDWQKSMNDYSFEEEELLSSGYIASNGLTFQIITYEGCTHTMIRMPDE